MHSGRTETPGSYYLKQPLRHLGCVRQPQPVVLGTADAAVAGLQRGGGAGCRGGWARRLLEEGEEQGPGLPSQLSSEMKEVQVSCPGCGKDCAAKT